MYNYVVNEIQSAPEVADSMKKEFLDLVEMNKDNFHARTNMNGHITGSMLVFNKDGSKVLLTLHGKFKRWLQLGGHWDEINETCLNTAVREMFEEGFGNKEVPFKMLQQEPLDLDIHNAGDHKHYDICYVCKVDDEALAECSHESEEIKWTNIEDVLNDEKTYRPRIGRMILKAQKFFQ